VHTNGNGPKFALSALDSRKKRIAVANVGNQREAAYLVGHATKGGFIAPDNRHAHTVAREFARDGRANAATSAGNERNARLGRHSPLLYT
jgi:hypothetical protein